ncbi:RecQ mediated genome instability 2, partial [Columba livia]
SSKQYWRLGSRCAGCTRRRVRFWRSGCPRPSAPGGKYVMVMGVVRSCSPEPVLRAIKMTDLSENPVHKNMWSLEVEDLHRVIP